LREVQRRLDREPVRRMQLGEGAHTGPCERFRRSIFLHSRDRRS
jgi:hypothetical protein